MIHLFDPQAAIKRIQAGEVPPGWRVLKADISYRKALRVAFADTDASKIFAQIFVIGLFIGLFFFLRNTYNITIEYLFLPIANIFTHPIGYLLTDIRAKRSLLLLTPEGFLEHKNARKPILKGKAYAYAEIASIKMVYYRNYEACLQFTPYQGKVSKWHCPYWYGPPQQIAQDIIDAHTQYQALNRNSDTSGKGDE